MSRSAEPDTINSILSRTCPKCGAFSLDMERHLNIGHSPAVQNYYSTLSKAMEGKRLLCGKD